MKAVIAAIFICFSASCALAQPNGFLDASFSQNGLAFYAHSPYTLDLNRIVVQPDGKILFAGHTGSSPHILLMRINADSTLDNTFGENGLVVDSSFFSASVRSILLDDNGKIYISVQVMAASFANEMALMRFNSDGTPDNGFGVNGVVYAPTAADEVDPELIRLSDGTMVGFYSDFFGTANIEMFGLDANGVANPAFGNAGFASITGDIYGFPSGVPPHAVALADGKFAVLVKKIMTDENFIVRFHANGVVDSTFGTNGWVLEGTDELLVYMGLYTDAASNLYTLINADDDFPYIYHVRKYTSAGVPDASFGNNGDAALKDDFWGNALAVQDDGQIVAVGYTGETASEYSAFIAKLKADGTADSSFAVNGYNTLELSGFLSGHRAVAVTDYKIYTAGFIQTTFTDSRGMVARYNYDQGVSAATLEYNNAVVTVYPNPSTADFTVQVEGLQDDVTLRVSNQLGQIVYEKILLREIKQMVISTSNWSCGAYSVSLGGATSLNVARLVKQ